MRSSWKFLVTVVAISLAAPPLAIADEVEEQLRQMQQRMTELENKLQATNDELESSKERVEQQEELIQKAGIDESRGAGSGLSGARFHQHDPGRWLRRGQLQLQLQPAGATGTSPSSTAMASFGPTTVFGENQGVLGLTAPGLTNANSFQLDQLWFGIGKPPTMESNAGFRADIVYGAARRREPRRHVLHDRDDDAVSFDDHGTGDLPHLFQAYVEYLVPVGANGISVKGGRFATPIGAESLRQDANFNITRGITWALQPVNHTGVDGGRPLRPLRHGLGTRRGEQLQRHHVGSRQRKGVPRLAQVLG